MPVIETIRDGIIQPHETYITPLSVVKCQVENADVELSADPKYILDPCAGTGQYGKILRQKYPNAVIIGVEIQPRETLLKLDHLFDENKQSYTEWYEQSIFDYFHRGISNYFDLIITNPPFSLTTRLVFGLWEFLADNGILSFLNRIELLESQKRYKGLFDKRPLKSVNISVDRIPWLNHPKGKDGQSDYKMYAFYQWKYGWSSPIFETKLVSWREYE